MYKYHVKMENNSGDILVNFDTNNFIGILLEGENLHQLAYTHANVEEMTSMFAALIDLMDTLLKDAPPAKARVISQMINSWLHERTAEREVNNED